jgi:hypothetical protein
LDASVGGFLSLSSGCAFGFWKRLRISSNTVPEGEKVSRTFYDLKRFLTPFSGRFWTTGHTRLGSGPRSIRAETLASSRLCRFASPSCQLSYDTGMKKNGHGRSYDRLWLRSFGFVRQEWFARR